ncbi:sugar phosphate isomerase, partial [Streptomyces albidoflavus]
MNHPTSAPPQPDPAAIRRTLAGQLDADARAWLDTALTEAAEDPGTGPLPVWERRFAEAGRVVGAGPPQTHPHSLSKTRGGRHPTHTPHNPEG